MVYKFKSGQSSTVEPGANVINFRMDLTFDVPAEIAEQLELWGLHRFDDCRYDQERKLLKLSATTTLYRKEV